MNHQQNLTRFLNDLVSNFGNRNNGALDLPLADLPKEEQHELARLYLEANGRDITECVNGDDFSIDNDYTTALLVMLQDASEKNRQAFANVVLANVVKYYASTFQALLDQACNDHEAYLQDMKGFNE